MTGRQQLEAILDRRPTDRLPWSLLVDGASLDLVPPERRGRGGLDLYAALGCIDFHLGGWGLDIPVPLPVVHFPGGVDWQAERDGTRVVQRLATPTGILTAIRDRVHPVKYPVDSLAAVRGYRELWEGATYTCADATAAWTAVDAEIGDLGLPTQWWGPSAIPRLLENDMGTENFYYLMADHPDDVVGLIDAIHRAERVAFRQLAEAPVRCATLVENTSTYYISPAIYRDFNMPHQRDFVDIMHAAGKLAIMHMCGHVHGILDLIRETGCDGIHALTPHPTGDTPWEDALDVLGDDLIILGAVDPTLWVTPPLERIGPALDALLTPRLRAAHVLPIFFADGIPVAHDRLQTIAAWFADNA